MTPRSSERGVILVETARRLDDKCKAVPIDDYVLPSFCYCGSRGDRGSSIS